MPDKPEKIEKQEEIIKPFVDSRPDTWEHIHMVQTLLTQVIQNLLERSLEHDQSKLKEPEVEFFNEAPKLDELTFGSSEYEESRAKLKKALEHHYAKNTHHPEHYPHGVDEMDLLDIVEMLVDWKASSHRQHDGNIMQSLKKAKERFNISDQLFKILENTVARMGWHK